MQDLLTFNFKKLENTNKPQLSCVLPPTVALMSHPTAQITLPCEAAWFVRSHENPALVYYIPCPEYKAKTLRDSCWSGNSIEKSPVDCMNFFWYTLYTVILPNSTAIPQQLIPTKMMVVTENPEINHWLLKMCPNFYSKLIQHSTKGDIGKWVNVKMVGLQ